MGPSAILLLVIVTITNIATIISAINIQQLVRRCSGHRVISAVAFLRPDLCSNSGPSASFVTFRSTTGYFSIQRRALFITVSTTSSKLTTQRPSSLKLDNMANDLTTQSNSAEAVASEEAIKLLRQRKQSLRKQIRSRIKSTYPPTENDKLSTQSNLVFSRLFTLPEYQSAKSIGFFLSMPSGEIQTRNAIQQIVKDGKVLFVPRVGLDFEKCDMDLVRCETSYSSNMGDGVFYDSWPRNKWGIPEPPVTTSNIAKPGDIDLLIVPGLSFDTHGHRLGQGKGYYDRFIAKMREGNDDGNGSERKPHLVGVCLEEQFLDEVPHGVDLGVSNDGSGGIIPVSDHDYIMDMVLTPSRTLMVPKS
ncbi:hypothetical protein ACHAXR_001640 [Thalassiosira sp. AJA248-18]